ncbi:MAG: hypothetical protein EXR68_04095 [Dehalococcoidia bacterium]|nr:hypothetical protein [Dehalococcoidia bacterium]
MSRYSLRFVGLVLAALLIGACGGNAETSASAPAPASSTNAAPVAGLPGAAFCGDWARASAQAQRVGGPPTGSPADLRSSLDTAVNVSNSLASQASADVRADLQLFAKGFTEFNAAMANFDSTKMATGPELRKAAEAMSDPRMEAASKNIQAWMEKNCAIGR